MKINGNGRYRYSAFIPRNTLRVKQPFASKGLILFTVLAFILPLILGFSLYLSVKTEEHYTGKGYYNDYTRGENPPPIVNAPGLTWYGRATTPTPTLCSFNKDASLTQGTITTTTVLNSGNTLCWFTPTAPGNTGAGIWSFVLDNAIVSNSVQNLIPNANGDVNQWSIGTGCGIGFEFQCVDEGTTNDGDTSYLTSSSATRGFKWHANLGAFTALIDPPGGAIVTAYASCRKTANQLVIVHLVIKENSVTTLGTAQTNCANSATYTVWNQAWSTKPSNGLSWNDADLDALQSGCSDEDLTTRVVRCSHTYASVSYRPVYQAEILKCSVSDCTAYSSLWTGYSDTYGTDSTTNTASIAAQTCNTASCRFGFRITMSSANGAISFNYDDDIVTADSYILVPEYEIAIAIPILALLFVIQRRMKK